MYDISVPFGVTFSSVQTRLFIFQGVSCFSDFISKQKTTPKVATTNAVMEVIPKTKNIFFEVRPPKKPQG